MSSARSDDALAAAPDPEPAAAPDGDDPIWAPIEGVSLDQYAAVTFGLLKYGVTGVDAVERYAAEHGVPEGRWPDVQAGWVDRMAQHAVARDRYGRLYSQRA